MSKKPKPGNPGMKIVIRVGKKRKTFESIEAVAQAFKIPYVTLYQRLFVLNWDTNKAVTTPVRKMKKKRKTAKKRK